MKLASLTEVLEEAKTEVAKLPWWAKTEREPTMNVCGECGRVKPEPTYEMIFRPEEIPKIILDEALTLMKEEEKAGLYAGYGGSQYRLLRECLKKVVLNKLNFWKEQN